ncbi:MAG: 4-alpha-glucanotransferase [Bacteroidetes bacterium]|nr:MAG: 4-alpha-glucanotransferase [Bacteroidota bacterium]
MTLNFFIPYQTQWGQQLKLTGNLAQLGAGNPDLAPQMQYRPGGLWTFSLELPDETQEIQYHYFIHDERSGWQEHESSERKLLLDKNMSETEVHDLWRSGWDVEAAWDSSAFRRALMPFEEEKRKKTRKPALHSAATVRFQLYAPRVKPGHRIYVSGSSDALGNWKAEDAVPLDGGLFPTWYADVSLTGKEGILRYKYLIRDEESGEVLAWENGSDRVIDTSVLNTAAYLQADEKFRYPGGYWRGSGVALPVFSLRSQASWGVGELSDIKLLVDWAVRAGMNLVQILPINDTVATHSWADSYPYAAISVFALHPLYLRPDAIGSIKDKAMQAELEAERQALNALPEVDYPAVMALKSRYFKILYDQNQQKFLKEKAYQVFFEENKDWLLPYAVFSCLRDRFHTADFHTWPEYSSYQAAEAEDFASPDKEWYNDVAIHYYIQYHLHLQMSEAATYARSRGVILKGDIPIGIYRHSVDAWTAPYLYHMDAQAGAPPDAFAVAGQNWRFPTYNWQVMAQDGYAWWRSRMTQLSGYFDAFRIDHILGFFRIWEIPGDAVQGILGHFNPCLPLSRQELMNRSLWLDYERYCMPYIRAHLLGDFLGNEASWAAPEFLEEYLPGCYRMREYVNTQRKVEAVIEAKIAENPDNQAMWERVRDGLYGLLAEVIFVEVPGTGGEGFSPRIALHQTRSYQELDGRAKAAINEIYTDFFFRRHEEFWRQQALIKLPAIKYATDMLVCGEDLGMVPACVPGVMKQLGILSLEIQRMPKQSDREFFHPGDAPYLSVVSTSTHDMPTLRGWWEGDRGAIQRFYSRLLGREGGAPFFCEPWVARDILVQHLFSPAMWAIFPIQDLLAMDNNLRRLDPAEEQINDPANPHQLWRYRMHLSLEELMAANDFNDSLNSLISQSGRNQAY